MAKKLGFESFIPMGYLRRRRFDYTAKRPGSVPETGAGDHCPGCEGAYERQKEALGIEHLYYYDESLTSPDEIRSRSVIMEYLVGEAQKMYRELSKESGEFFDFMIEHDLFDLESKHGKRAGGTARYFLSTMHRSSSPTSTARTPM